MSRSASHAPGKTGKKLATLEEARANAAVVDMSLKAPTPAQAGIARL